MTYKNFFSIPISKKRQLSMKRRFSIFSSILFLLIFIFGSIAFITLMGQILHKSAREELMKTVGLERYKMEASVNAKIAIVLKMANSAFIRRYFSSPDDPELNKLALEEIKAYSLVLAERTIFWINNQDKIFFSTGNNPYQVDPESWENYWYNMTLYETDSYNFNINYNPDLDVTNLWLNAPVFDDENKPIGIVGAGIDLSKFINNIYTNFSGYAELYFYNSAGEITGARNINLVSDKINLEQALNKTGSEILSQTEYLINTDIIHIDLKNTDGVAVLGTIPVLNWYITAVHNFSAGEYLYTGMFALFVVMIAIIFIIFAAFNLFVVKLMEPLYQIVNGFSRISEDFELDKPIETSNKNEIETIGELMSMTMTDQLTGIYNRRFFNGNMKKIIRYLSRSGGILSVLMIDVDNFKKYNDTYGHYMGDICLKKIASALSKMISREDDFLARYGGEEFIAVLPNTDENGALSVAEKLLSTVYECYIPHEKNDAAEFVTISIGGTTGGVKHSQNANDYVKYADIALYKSKHNGRNKYTFECFNAK